MKLEIKNRWSGAVQYSCELSADVAGQSYSVQLGFAVIAARESGANLRGANLRGANLRDADLCGANLRDADLCGADLRDANLRDANLRGANLRGANLRGANLRDADLCGADLCGADLCGADLCDANLCGADLRDADLRDANLRDADLRDADLRDADLCGADLRDADLRDADLRGANLRGANLRGANLRGADLRGADLCGAKNAELAIAKTRILPDGDLIGWKKCRFGVIVKLRIPEAAKRCHAFGRKCRAEYADVLEVFNGDKGISAHDGKTEYVVGARIMPDAFDTDWTNECSNGVHFFITRLEAENYV